MRFWVISVVKSQPKNIEEVEQTNKLENRSDTIRSANLIIAVALASISNNPFFVLSRANEYIIWKKYNFKCKREKKKKKKKRKNITRAKSECVDIKDWSNFFFFFSFFLIFIMSYFKIVALKVSMVCNFYRL